MITALNDNPVNILGRPLVSVGDHASALGQQDAGDPKINESSSLSSDKVDDVVCCFAGDLTKDVSGESTTKLVVGCLWKQDSKKNLLWGFRPPFTCSAPGIGYP